MPDRGKAKRRAYLASLISDRTWLLGEQRCWMSFKRVPAGRQTQPDQLDEFSDDYVYLPEPAADLVPSPLAVGVNPRDMWPTLPRSQVVPDSPSQYDG